MRENKKAVAVAKDVLKHLTGYKVRSGNSYIKHDNFEEEDYFGICKTELSKKIQKECEVCALGACLVSAFNTGFAQPKHLYQFINENFNEGMNTLKDILGKDYREIELAFETTDRDAIYYESDSEFFGSKFSDDKERLRAIMHNIVENRGNFVPGKEGENAAKYLKAAKRRKKA